MKRIISLSMSLLSLLLPLAGHASSASSASIPVGTYPKFLAVNQATNRVYVSNFVSNNVSVIDGDSNSVVATIPVGESPESIDVNAVTNVAYVANLSSNTVSVIDGNTNTVTASIAGFSSPYGVTVDAVTNQVFVSNLGSSSVSVIDGSSNAIIAVVTVGGGPAGVRVNSALNIVYAVNSGPGTVSVIDGQTDTVTNTFNLPQGAEPNLIALDPITNRLFITNGVPALVYVVDASSGSLLATITGSNAAFEFVGGVAMFQPGKTVLIADKSRNVVVDFAESTYAATAGLRGGNGPMGIAVNRQTGKIYVAESGNGTVNVYTQPK